MNFPLKPFVRSKVHDIHVLMMLTFIVKWTV